MERAGKACWRELTSLEQVNGVSWQLWSEFRSLALSVVHHLVTSVSMITKRNN